jgi:uncharacterized repeat protein (TIGR03843 family)
MSAADLVDGDLELTGRITTASNATFLGSIGDVPVVYKPIAGESPLWDFPDGNLANREAAAYLVSQSLGWNVVPRTWLRDGPMGPGMVQLWQDADPEQDAVDLVPADAVPDEGWRQVLDGRDENNRLVSLIHEDSAPLRRMAVFDIIVNNADRKGAHILAMPDGHRHGVDHGLTFHTDHKLRTVLWGWLGEELTADELAGIDRIRDQLGSPQGGGPGADRGAGRGTNSSTDLGTNPGKNLGATLADLLTAAEIDALAARCDRLRTAGRFPAPAGQMPAVPWPLF